MKNGKQVSRVSSNGSTAATFVLPMHFNLCVCLCERLRFFTGAQSIILRHTVIYFVILLLLFLQLRQMLSGFLCNQFCVTIVASIVTFLHTYVVTVTV